MKKLLTISLIALILIFLGCNKQDATGAVVGLKSEQTCTDSDGGLDKNTQGVVMVGDEDYADDCVVGLLIEYYCDGNNIANQNIRCPKECSGGKCI